MSGAAILAAPDDLFGDALTVTERQAGEYRIEIGTRTSLDGFGPNNIQKPRSDFGNAKVGAPGSVRFYNGHGLFVEVEVGHFDRRPGQRFAFVQHANRQVARFAKRVRITLRNDFKRQPNGFGRTRVGTPGVVADMDQHFGTATINLTSDAVGGPCPLPVFEYRREPLILRIIGKALGRQFGRGMIGLHRHDVDARLRESRREMRSGSTLFKATAEIDGAVRSDRLQHNYAFGISLPSSAIVAVADQCGDGQSDIGLRLEGSRLQPEIMRGSRCGNQDERQFGKSEAHGGRRPSGFYRSGPPRGEALRLSNSNWRNVRGRAVGLVFTSLLTIYSVPAYAHDDAGAASGVAAGLSHPFLGADHMLAMIAVGIWGAFLGKPLLVILPMVFPVMMTVGAALAMAGMPFPPVELGIAISVIALGLLILAAARAVPVVACAVVAIFALFHGYAHGTELPATADPVGYSVGFVLATGLLHLAGIGLGLLKTLRFGELGLRAAGAVTAVAGGAFLFSGLPQ